MPTDTVVLPTVDPSATLPPPGVYTLRHNRCVIEYSARLARLPIVRRRLRPGTGQLIVRDTGEHALTFEVMTKELRVVKLTADVAMDGRRRLRITGWLDIGEQRRTVRMTARVVHIDADTVVFAALGTAVAPRSARRSTGPSTRRLGIVTAVEFSR